jgi:two-component system, OmpR family, heavy metal sensor histidine kinase CusS
MMRRFSLTTRLTACYALVAAVLLLGMTWMIAAMVSQHFLELDRETLGDKLSLVEGIVMRSHASNDVAPRLQDALQNHPGLFVRVSRIDTGTVLFQSADFEFPPSMLGGTQSPSGNDLTVWRRGQEELRAMTREVKSTGDSPTTWRIAAAVDTHNHEHFVRSLKRSLLSYAVLASILSAILGWWAARTGLSPLRDMKTRAQAVTANKLDQRMPAESVPIEMADLAHSLNDMLQRLQADFQRLSEFSSDLAHELRTPISNLLTQTQVVLAQNRTIPEYQDTLASNAEEFQRLARMVSDMLLLAKAEHGLLLPSKVEIHLRDEVNALIDFYEALADEKSIALLCYGDGVIVGDRLMLRRAISNLLSNALRHTPHSGLVEIEIEAADSSVVLRVMNTGPDIPAEQLPRLFDRFYRADKSRTHVESDGAGLGLAITRAIILAHAGEVAVTSSKGQTAFELKFHTAMASLA